MRTIREFPLEFTCAGQTDGIVTIPRGAQIVHFAVEYRGDMDSGPRPGVPTIWAEVDDQEAPTPRTFKIFDTNDALPDGAVHVATFPVGNTIVGPFAAHVYDTTLAIELPAEIEGLPQEAINAFRLLRREGFTYRGVMFAAPVWAAPDGEPTTTEQMMALATLAEHGLGTLASA